MENGSLFVFNDELLLPKDPRIPEVYAVAFDYIPPESIISFVKKYETNEEFKKALEKSLAHSIPDQTFKELMIGMHPVYSDQDFKEILAKLGGKPEKAAAKTLPDIIKAISEEVALWQEIKLQALEPQLRKVRQTMFGSPKHLGIKKAEELTTDFLKSGDISVRVAYVHLFLERTITARDMKRYFSELKPNQYECLLAAMALIANRAYLSNVGALRYFLTGEKVVGVGIFNPTMVLVTFHLAKYLQSGRQASRSLLSSREMSLLRLMGTANGKPKPTKLWPVWNQQNPNWAYDSWRMFWKACQRAKTRLLKTYDMAFEIERMALEDPQRYWEFLQSISNRT
jgi:hypothetical protein